MMHFILGMVAGMALSALLPTLSVLTKYRRELNRTYVLATAAIAVAIVLVMLIVVFLATLHRPC